MQVPTRAEDGFQLRPEEIEQRITPRTKAILIGYPANPTGAVMSREVMLAVADDRREAQPLRDLRRDLRPPRLRRRARLLLDAARHARAHDPDGRLLEGVRDDGLAARRTRAHRSELTEAMMKVHQYVMMSAPTPAQFAAIEALNSGEEDVRGMVAEYDRRRQLVVSGLQCDGADVRRAAAAPSTPSRSIGSSGMNDETFAERLLMEERVAVIPGSAFGEAGAGHVRICYAQNYESAGAMRWTACGGSSTATASTAPRNSLCPGSDA